MIGSLFQRKATKSSKLPEVTMDLDFLFKICPREENPSAERALRTMFPPVYCGSGKKLTERKPKMPAPINDPEGLIRSLESKRSNSQVDGRYQRRRK
jgi:hypothetical protein